MKQFAARLEKYFQCSELSDDTSLASQLTLLILLLVVTVQRVYPSDKLVAPPTRPIGKDPCATHEVSCNPSGSTEGRVVIWVSSVISLSLLFMPIIRIRQAHLCLVRTTRCFGGSCV